MITEIKDLYVDAYKLYAIFKDEPFSFILESGMDHENLGRYSFISFDPFKVFKSKKDRITIISAGNETVLEGNPFDCLRTLLNEYKMDYSCEIPFTGGAVGYFGYDMCHHIEKLHTTVIDDVDIPDCFLGFYDGVVIIDHLKKKTYVAAYGIEKDKNHIIEGIIKKIHEELPLADSKLVGEIPSEMEDTQFRSNFTKEQYMKALDAIHEHIRMGDIYQVNLTQRFQADLKTSPERLYQILRKVNPAPFASFIDFGEGAIVSSSPERYIRLKDGHMETRPIKGTMPRGRTPEEDARNREILENSEKDKAELLMIVDLERNDLGRVARTGTVKVTELFKLEVYPTVFHLVSTVTGELKGDKDAVDLIVASFPGGSITGAPKIRAMEIIDELEPTARKIYTGSIGYIGFNGDLDLNIVIRTFICKDNMAYFQAGGGIVWDSSNESEYEETFHKAAALMKSIRIANKMG